jgi:two-component system nitrate/nitrite sensor histidine kinase NarX
VHGVDERGERKNAGTFQIAPAIANAGEKPAHSLLLTAFELERAWSGRVILLAPAAGRTPEKQVRFLHKLVREIVPAVHGVYLLRRLRSRAGAAERARVARELHDGAIQSLVSLEMQVDVLRRVKEEKPGALEDRLSVIQHLLHQEVLNVRDLMEQVRPLEVGPRDLLEHLAERVEKFRAETGINATFAAQLEEITLPPRDAREVSRIVQEALINVRKHSGATHVVVRFSAEDGHWKLVIDDDGRGFPFSGRYSLEELDSARIGPLVLKERVRALAGELTVESEPGRGARLEINFPQRAYA